MEGKVDNNHQDNHADNPGQGRAKVDRNHCKGTRRKRDNTNNDGGLHHRLSLDDERQISCPEQ